MLLFLVLGSYLPHLLSKSHADCLGLTSTLGTKSRFSPDFQATELKRLAKNNWQGQINKPPLVKMSGVKEEALRVEDDNLKLVHVNLPTDKVQSRDGRWKMYHRLTGSLGSQIKQVRESINSVEKRIGQDEEQSNLNSQLQLVHLILMLLKKATRTPATLTKKWYKMIGWIILLSVVIAATVIGCLCSISQCLPLNSDMLKISMQSRHNEVSWKSSEKTGQNRLQVENTFSNGGTLDKMSVAVTSPMSQADMQRNTYRQPVHGNCRQPVHGNCRQPVHGNCRQCFTKDLFERRKQLNELKCWGEGNSVAKVRFCTPPRRYSKRFSEGLHNKEMSGNVRGFGELSWSAQETDGSEMADIPKMPHASAGIGPHSVERCRSEGTDEVLDLPHSKQ